VSSFHLTRSARLGLAHLMNADKTKGADNPSAPSWCGNLHFCVAHPDAVVR
jgi:hypothetical protein